MAISKKNMQKLKYLWKDENAVYWIESFLKIVDKSGKLVPFILTNEQREVVQTMQRENIILKSRQLGLSSVVVALSIRACVVKDNTTCLLVSHNQQSTNTIFDKLKQQFNSLPSWLRPKTLSNNRQEIKMANGSKITCVTAGNKDIGRGDTFNGIVHLSEFAFWKNPDKQLKALTQALGDTGKIIIESTADGFNKFSDVYYDAKNGVNTYKPYFFNWINGGTLFTTQYKMAMKKFRGINGRDFCEDDFDDEEKKLSLMGASIEQLCWRKQKVATDGEDTFHVEFPSSDDECFLTTGSQIFDTKRIDSLLSVLKKDNYIKLDKIVGLPVILRQYYGNSLKIWELPKAKEHYWLGVDCSEGVGGDSQTIVVLDKDCVQVAQFKNNKIKPYQFSDIVDSLGRYYNKGKLAIEKASGGHSVIERVRYDKKYMNMLKYKTYDELNRLVWQVGFDTNAKTKSIIVNDFREYFERGMIKINSLELIDEMKVFVSDGNKMGAITGCHDDLVMATCLAIACIKDTFYYTF